MNQQDKSMEASKIINKQQLLDNGSNCRQRILSVDALRGFDMIWILGAEGIFAALFVMTGWSWTQSLAMQMQHSNWHGISAYDVIFPLFIFLAGVSLGISAKPMSQYPVAKRKAMILGSVKRLILLILLGVIYNHGWGNGIPMHMEDVRFVSVLGRIGIAWFVATMVCWYLSERAQWLLAISILIAYWLLLTVVEVSGFGGGNYSQNWALNAWFDAKFMPGASYKGLLIDPEGLLSNVSSIVNALAGVFIARVMMNNRANPNHLILLLLFWGSVCVALGFLWHLVFPINKTLWTSSFAMITIGYSILLLMIFYYLFDVLKLTVLAKFFAVIGCNSIVIYLSTSIVNWQYISNSLFGGIINSFGGDWAMLLKIVFLVVTQWLFLYWLYRRNILVKKTNLL